jgi:hypothetical protein
MRLRCVRTLKDSDTIYFLRGARYLVESISCDFICVRDEMDEIFWFRFPYHIDFSQDAYKITDFLTIEPLGLSIQVIKSIQIIKKEIGL